MIFTDRTITVKNGNSSINEPIILYRGDKEVEIRFVLKEKAPFIFNKEVDSNIIELSEAAYGQLIIKRPNDLPAVFSEIVPTNEGKIIFTITAEMIDEITEVGNYTFQIRLLDESRNSRATLPEVANGIEIREPIATEDVSTTNEVNVAIVGYALTTAGTTEDTFDTQGNYNKTTWETGDRITAAKLNKIEAGIDGVNKKVASGGTGGNVDLSNYVTKGVGNASQITFADGQTFQAKLDAGTLKGEKGDKGADGLTTSISLNGITYTQENGVITLPNITSGGNIPSVTHIEPEALDMPKVFFNGDKPTNKTSVHATIEYISKTEHFKGYVDIKCQGNSSMAYPKKNYTIKMFRDEARSTKLKKDFKGWGKQSKFCLKANYIDHSHARNVVSAKLWGQVVKSRSDFDTLPEELKTSPNYGAVDGFPIKVYYNNTYEGVYTWNIPKDGWMNNMDDKLNTHCILCSEEYNSGCFRSVNASAWSDELHDVMPASIATSFNNFQRFVINSSDDEFKTGLSTYADVNSLIDYYIFQYVICGMDSMGKNQLFFTYDGVKWIASSYDMDSTFGLYWNGQRFVSATYRMQEDYESMISGRPGNLLYMRMEQLFCDEIKARYAELRAGALSYANIVNEFERFMDVIGKDLYAEDLTIYTGIPSGSTNNIQQIRNYTRDRLTYVDTQIEALRKLIPCTGIVLSADTLSFTTTDTQTLSVVVSPDNCTDAVTWSVSPTNIVSVDNGVVTPITNGSCTITATCGSYSDTCAVTVSLPSVECTGITLDKTELALGVFSEKIDDSSVNYLDGVEWKDGQLNGSGQPINGTDKYAEINVTLPGKYTFSTTNNYSYLKIYAIYENDIVYGTTIEASLTEQTINVFEPCTIRCSAYPNSLEWDSSSMSITRQDFSSCSSKDVNYGLIESDINVKYSNSEYRFAEVYLDKIYEIATINFNNNSYKCTCKKSLNANETAINDINSLLTKNLVFVGEYNSKTYLNITLPASMGTSASEILANMTSTTITINSTDELAKLETPSTSKKLSEQLTATVTPENCTQPVVWSALPEGIVTVDNGLVTAVTNGEATVTATCGTQTATCNVTVSGMSESGGDTGETYTDIEYIESTGTQYINTRIVPTSSTKIELVAEMSASKQYDHIFGSDNFMKAQWMDGTGTAIEAVKKNSVNHISGLTLGKHTYVMDMTDTTNVMTIDGTKYGTAIGNVESTTCPLLLLSGYSRTGSIETRACGVGKIYSCKIYYEDTLVANMKPIISRSGTYGLLDTVNNTFYASEVGSFTGGGTEPTSTNLL